MSNKREHIGSLIAVLLISAFIIFLIWTARDMVNKYNSENIIAEHVCRTYCLETDNDFYSGYKSSSSQIVCTCVLESMCIDGYCDNKKEVTYLEEMK